MKKIFPHFLCSYSHFLAFYAGFAIPDCAAFFISSFKVSDAWNVFAPLNSHLIPLLLFMSSMSSLVTYEMYSPPFGEIARRLFLENSILLRLPTQLKAAPWLGVCVGHLKLNGCPRSIFSTTPRELVNFPTTRRIKQLVDYLQGNTYYTYRARR